MLALKNVRSALVLLLLATIANAAEPSKQQTAYFTFVPTTAVDPTELLSDAIVVSGQVNSPQSMKVKGEISVLDAIAAADGLNTVSSRTEFTITGPKGSMTWRGPSFNSPEGKELYSRIMIKPGETLYIPDLCRL